MSVKISQNRSKNASIAALILPSNHYIIANADELWRELCPISYQNPNSDVELLEKYDTLDQHLSVTA